MIKIVFLNGKETVAQFSNLTKNIVQLKGEYILNNSGFKAFTEKGIFLGDYSDFTTIYREVDGGVQLSNDGSIYVKPVPKVVFNTSNGGTIDGETLQEANDYSELIIPTPIADTDFEFTEWSPEIPLSGEIDGNKSFTAIFTSTVEPETETTLEERMTVIEEDISKINNALGGV